MGSTSSDAAQKTPLTMGSGRRRRVGGARLQHGWVPLDRKTLFGTEVWSWPLAWRMVYVAILGQANYEPGACVIDGQEVAIPVGSLVIGSRSFAEFCGVSRQQLRDAL